MGKDLRQRVAGIALGDQRIDLDRGVARGKPHYVRPGITGCAEHRCSDGSLARHGETFRSRSFRYKPESSPKLIGTSDTGYRRYDAGGIDNATAIAAFAGMMETEAARTSAWRTGSSCAPWLYRTSCARRFARRGSRTRPSSARLGARARNA